MHTSTRLTQTTIRVFISYTHDSDQHRTKVLQLADSLNKHGIRCNLDQYEIALKNGDGAGWMEKQIRDSHFVLLVCTKEYLGAWEDTLPIEKRRGARWEILHIRNAVYAKGSKNEKFVPILLTHADEAHIPSMLGTASRYIITDQYGYDNLYWRLTGQSVVETPSLGSVVTRPTTARPKIFAPPGSVVSANIPAPNNQKKVSVPPPDDVAFDIEVVVPFKDNVALHFSWAERANVVRDSDLKRYTTHSGRLFAPFGYSVLEHSSRAAVSYEPGNDEHSAIR